jgi:hypothetical protein
MIRWPRCFLVVARGGLDVLKGAKPAELPVQRATKVEMIIDDIGKPSLTGVTT